MKFKMRVLHVGSCNVLAGGPALSTWLTVKGLRELGVETSVIMEPVRCGKIINDEVSPVFSSPLKLGSLCYAPHLSRTLGNLGLFDVYHIQGVWMYNGTQVANFAKKHNRPYVVTLRGMLYPQALAHNSLVKRLSLSIYQGATLRDASVVQCTCMDEMRHYRALGFGNPVAVIPNPIETEKYVNQAICEKSRFRVGYLGRIHPRKRVERLIYAFDCLRDKLPADAQLLIIGGGDEVYEAFLKKEVERLKLTGVVRFTGFLSGSAKDEAIDSLSVLAVPSDFENFGNIVTEALVHGVPVIASKGMPWQELVEHGCGWWISNDQESINATILEAFDCGPARLMQMGLNGRKLMQSGYSVDTLGRKMKSVYDWIVGTGEKPEFVYTD